MNASQILTRIIEKGSILGQCAEFCSNDNKKTDLFIKECFEQCETNMAWELWGGDLIADIKRYCKSQNEKNKKVSDFSFLIINTIKTIRKQKGIKQGVIANSLNMKQSNYSKIEDGLRPLTTDQLNIIATMLGVSALDILASSLKKKERVFE